MKAFWWKYSVELNQKHLSSILQKGYVRRSAIRLVIFCLETNIKCSQCRCRVGPFYSCCLYVCLFDCLFSTKFFVHPDKVNWFHPIHFCYLSRLQHIYKIVSTNLWIYILFFRSTKYNKTSLFEKRWQEGHLD